MSTFTLGFSETVTSRDLTATSVPGGIQLAWKGPDTTSLSVYSTKIYKSSTDYWNALECGEVPPGTTTFFYPTETTGETWKFWVRDMINQGNPPAPELGPPYPGAYSTGIEGVGGALAIANAANSVVSSASISVGTGLATITSSSYDTWETNTSNYISFEPGDDNGLINTFLAIKPTIGDPASGSMGDTINCWARVRLYDNTNEEDVPGGVSQFLLFSAMKGVSSWITLVDKQTLIQGNMSYRVGFGGQLSKNIEYRLYVDLKRERSGTGTITLSADCPASEVSGASFG